MAEREQQLDDRALVSRVLGGDRDRFTELVKRYEKRVVNYVYRITHRYEEAHDLAQEIFVKVFVALDRYDSKYQFSTWLFRIAHNSVSDYNVSNRNWDDLSPFEDILDVEARTPLPEEVFLRKEQKAHLRDLIGTLSPRRKEMRWTPYGQQWLRARFAGSDGL